MTKNFMALLSAFCLAYSAMSYPDTPEPVAFIKEIKNALQKELSIGGARIVDVLKITEDSPQEYSVYFEWKIDKKKYKCDASVQTDEKNRVTEAVIPYVCYRPFIDQ
jgi:hypothetical protein